jgi:hypothetical protein
MVGCSLAGLLKHAWRPVYANESARGSDALLYVLVVSSRAARNVEDGGSWPQLQKFDGARPGGCVEHGFAAHPVVGTCQQLV